MRQVMKMLHGIPLVVLLAAGCAVAPKEPPQPLPQPTIEIQPKQVNGSIYQAGHDVRLYDDRIARRVGDLVTVVFEESTNAKKGASTNISKESDIDLGDRKSTRLNSSHVAISYAVFCLKKKTR